MVAGSRPIQGSSSTFFQALCALALPCFLLSCTEYCIFAYTTHTYMQTQLHVHVHVRHTTCETTCTCTCTCHITSRITCHTLQYTYTCTCMYTLTAVGAGEAGSVEHSAQSQTPSVLPHHRLPTLVAVACRWQSSGYT